MATAPVDPQKPLRKQKSYTFSSYAFAYIDILGQKEALAKISKIPQEGSPEHRAFGDLIQKSIGVVETARDNFLRFKTGIDRSLDSVPTSESNRSDQEGIAKNSELKIRAFSDTILLYSSLLETDAGLPIVGIFKMLGAIASTQIIAMSEGVFLRGGVDVGIGTELLNGDFYGPALLSAYLLERDAAVYPRVVVGDRLVQFLERGLSVQGEDGRARSQRAASKFANSLTGLDSDGRHFVDFLGKDYRHYSRQSLPSTIYDEVLKCTLEALEGFKREKNSKLAQRYLTLLNYVESCAVHWKQPRP